MRTLLIIDSIIIFTIGFIDWMLPQNRELIRSKFEKWWIIFVDLDHTQIGVFIIRLINNIFDRIFGKMLLGLRSIIMSIFFSLLFFLFLFLIVSVPNASITVNNLTTISSFINSLWIYIRPNLIPLALIYSVLNFVSLSFTRLALRRAERVMQIGEFVEHINSVSIITFLFIIISFFVYTNLFMSTNLIMELGLQLIFFSLVVGPITLFVIISLFYAFIPLFRSLIIVINRQIPDSKNTKLSLSVLLYNTIRDLIKRNKRKTVKVIIYSLLLLTPWILAWNNNFLNISLIISQLSNILTMFLIFLSLSSAIPFIMSISGMLIILVIRAFSGPFYFIISHFLLRIAEFKKGALYLVTAVFIALKDILTIILLK